MHSDPTRSFYQENAESYANRDRSLPKARLDAFLTRLPPGGSVLELGCGGGQDSAYMLAQGYDVLPTDGSAELAEKAEKRLGRPVKVMRFETLDADAAFDGVWANASLLHVPRADLSGVLKRIHRALKPDGTLYASFKAGEAEGHDTFGRYYNYPSAKWLSRLLEEGGWSGSTIMEADGGGYDGKPTSWLHITTQK